LSDNPWDVWEHLRRQMAVLEEAHRANAAALGKMSHYGLPAEVMGGMYGVCEQLARELARRLEVQRGYRGP